MLFRAVAVAAIAGLANAAPLRIKVASSAKLAVSNRAINQIVDRVSGYMAARRSFLMDAKDSKVKDGLFVSQPLRADSATRINVIERRGQFGTTSRGAGAASMAAHLRAQFDADLARLRSSFMRFSDIATRRAGSPTQVMTFAIESGIPEGMASRASFAYRSMMDSEKHISSLLG
jgi:hypothetical protein